MGSVPKSIFDFSAITIRGESQPLDLFRGSPLLIVNTASKCGFTDQYKGLEELYQRFRDRGLTVLGFPCNQFGGQEPASEPDIAQFCELSFGVTFPLFAKIAVNGPDTHPLYEFLKSEVPGLMGSQAIKWNFTKFLSNREGKPIKRFAPQDKPAALIPHIEKVLGPEAGS